MTNSSIQPQRAPDERRPTRRIVVSLTIVLAIVGLVPLAGFAWKLTQINEMALMTAQQEIQKLLARSVAHEIDVQFEGLRGELARVSQTLGAAFGKRGQVRESAVKQILTGVADERFIKLRYSYARDGRLNWVDSESMEGELEPALREGFTAATESLQGIGGSAVPTVVSRPVNLDVSPPKSVVVISAPVRSGRSFRGVLSAVVDLKSVWVGVANNRQWAQSLYAVDASGKVFASTDPVRYRPGFHYESPLTRKFLSKGHQASLTIPFSQDESDGSTGDYIGSYDTTAQGWGVFVVARSQDVYRPVQEMLRSTVAWAVGALLLAIIAAGFFARNLSRPINSLVAATREFAQGDYTLRVEVRTRNEIGELAGTFNQMAAQIKHHIEELENAAQDNNALFLGTIRALAQAIDAKDPYTRGHSLRVNRYSVIIARHMGLPHEEVKDIYVSSLLHDVGKIGIDDAVLKKPGRLTDEEFEIIKRHPVLGAEIMAPIPQMERIIPGLRWHHEKWAGGGYPDGLSGEAIPLMARIIAVADTFDAMTTHRPYQTAMTFSEALQRINTVLVGTSLDPTVVEAFNTACELGRIRPKAELESTQSVSLEAIRA